MTDTFSTKPLFCAGWAAAATGKASHDSTVGWHCPDPKGPRCSCRSRNTKSRVLAYVPAESAQRGCFSQASGSSAFCRALRVGARYVQQPPTLMLPIAIQCTVIECVYWFWGRCGACHRPGLGQMWCLPSARSGLTLICGPEVEMLYWLCHCRPAKQIYR